MSKIIYYVFLVLLINNYEVVAKTSVKKNTAVLIWVDREKDERGEITLTIGKVENFDNVLQIQASACYSNEEQEPEDHAMLIKIKNNNKDVLFNSWMLSERRDLFIFEHPRYNIWLKKCI